MKTLCQQNLADDLRENGWNHSEPSPDVVQTEDGRVVTVDHRRLVAAKQAGLEEVPATVHDPEQLISREDAKRFRLKITFTDPKTNMRYLKGDVPQNWGEAAKFRAANQRVLGYENFLLEGSSRLPEINFPKGSK